MSELKTRVKELEGQTFEVRLSKHAVQRVAERLLGITRPELYARWGDPPIIKLPMPKAGNYSIQENCVRFHLDRSIFIIALATEEELDTISDCEWVLITYFYRI